MKSAIVNLKTIVSGDWRKPLAKAIHRDEQWEGRGGTINAKEENSYDVASTRVG